MNEADMIGNTTDDSESSSRGFTGVDVCGPILKYIFKIHNCKEVSMLILK